MSQLLKLINRTSLRTSTQLYASICKYASNASYLQYDKDPGPMFTDTETQKLLKSITCPQLSKIFRKQPREVNAIEYKMMTTEQIEEQIKQSFEKAEYLLQMPPIVKVQQYNPKIISKDPALQSFSKDKFVITDITYGIEDTERMIVVRQTDGTLEYADAAIRKRINQIYFPHVGRKIRVPRMFEPENLKRCLDRHDYEFVLDRMCVQFEPYEQEFHDISSLVFQHVNDNKQFDILRSTRHFGPMSFFLAWHKIIDDLVVDMVQRDLLVNAVELICLMYNLNGIQYDKAILKELDQTRHLNKWERADAFAIAQAGLEQELADKVGKSADQFKADENCLKFVEDFSQSHAIKKSQISLSTQLYKESNEEKKRLLEGLKKAHGIAS